MTDSLNLYFERELALLRKSSDHYAKTHPNTARGMHLNEEYYEDPNITRLLESVALLSARCHQNIDQQLPHISSALSETLFPSANICLPAIVSTKFIPDEKSFADSVRLSKGERFSVKNQQNQLCTFSLCHDVELTPVRLSKIKATLPPFAFETPPQANAGAAISLQLDAMANDAEIRTLVPSQLALYINGFGKNSAALIELLLSRLSMILVSSPDFTEQVQLQPHRLNAEIGNSEFRILPTFQNEFSAYPLLMEYLNYDEKSKFFTLNGFSNACQKIQGPSVIITLLLKDMPADYVRLIDEDSFYINACLLVNAFEARSEPIDYRYETLSTPIIAESSEDEQIDILYVDKVSEITPEGEIPLTHLFKQTFYSDNLSIKWHVETTRMAQSGRSQKGMLLFLSQLEESINITTPKLITAKLLCSNGFAPSIIAAESALEPDGSIELPGQFLLNQTPSVALQPIGDQRHQWQVLELLSTNFSHLMNQVNPTKKLKQLLAIFCRTGTPPAIIQSIQKVSYHSSALRIHIEGKTLFTSGTRIALTLTQVSRESRVNYRLFLVLLNRFFAEFCSFDRFIELNVDLLGTQGKEHIDFAPQQGIRQCL